MHAQLDLRTEVACFSLHKGQFQRGSIEHMGHSHLCTCLPYINFQLLRPFQNWGGGGVMSHQPPCKSSSVNWLIGLEIQIRGRVVRRGEVVLAICRLPGP